MTADEYRKAIMRQAYADFLNWAWQNDALMTQYLDFVEEAMAQRAWKDAGQGFTQWVTEKYWGDVPE